MPAESPDFDVIVIGAGPAGCAAAIPLASSGASVLLVDKAKFPRQKICGDCVNPGCWKAFELLGVAGSVRSQIHQPIDQIKIINRQGSSFGFDLKKTGRSPFFAMDRRDLDAILHKQAESMGCAIMQDARIKDVRHENWWQIRWRDRGPVTAKFLIGADGRNSAAARAVSSTFPNKRRRNDDRVGVQWHVWRENAVYGSVELYLFGSGYFGLVDLDKERTNLAMVVEPRLARLVSQDFDNFLASTVLRNPAAAGLPTSFKPLNGISTAFPINPSKRIQHHPDVFLAGDARMTVEPFTGEGICFALYDGIGVAARILDRMKRNHRFKVSKNRNSFLPNRIFSPMLRKQRVGEWLLYIASRNRFMAEHAVNSIMVK